MSYLDNYSAVRNSYRKYLTGSQTKKLLDKSKEYSRQNAFSRLSQASDLQTGFKKGFNDLRNVGMQSSGEVERLKRQLDPQFVYANRQLDKNELASLNKKAKKYRYRTRRARARAAAERAKEQAALRQIAESGTRSTGRGTGRQLRTTR